MAEVGRPRRGILTRRYDDERVSSFVKLTGRYPPLLAAELRELARQLDEPLWGVLLIAAERYLDTIPPADRMRVVRRARSSRRELARDAAESYERNLERKAKARHAKD